MYPTWAGYTLVMKIDLHYPLSFLINKISIKLGGFLKDCCYMRNLSEEDKRQLFEAIKNDVNAEPRKVIGLYEGIREARFRNGLACVHCGSLRVKRKGTYRERQRYLCKDCGKSFNDISGTPLSGTHNPEKWMRYFLMMVEDNYLFWHRFLELNKKQDDKLVSNSILLASCHKPNFTTTIIQCGIICMKKQESSSITPDAIGFL